MITNGTVRHHEILALRTYIEQHDNEKEKQNKHLYVYDKAVTDFAWWDKQKQSQNFIISVLKKNAVARFVEPIPFDPNDERKTGIEGYSAYQNKKATFQVVEYRDPETGQRHKFISTLPKSINPGTIAMTYFKRWTIEKVLNNTQRLWTKVHRLLSGLKVPLLKNYISGITI